MKKAVIFMLSFCFAITALFNTVSVTHGSPKIIVDPDSTQPTDAV